MMRSIGRLIKKTPEFINSITSILLAKALEATARQHIGCFLFSLSITWYDISKMIEWNDAYLNAPETLDYKEKDLPFLFYNNMRLKYGYDIDENMIW